MAITLIVFGVGSFYILKLISKGPKTVGDGEKYYDHSQQASVTKASTEGDIL